MAEPLLAATAATCASGPREAGPRRRQTWGMLTAAFAAIALAFVCTTWVGRSDVRRIRSAARDITRNSSPSIKLVSSMRSELRNLELQVVWFVEECRARGSCPVTSPGAAHLRRQMLLDWEEYKRLPTFSTEEERWPPVDEAVATLDGLVSSVVATARAGRAAAATAALDDSLKPTCDRLDALLAELVQFDHEQGLQAATSIDRLSDHAIAISFVLTFLSSALAVLVGAVVVALVRRHERILRSRAEELDLFAGRAAHDLLSPLNGAMVALHVAKDDTRERGRCALELAERALANSVQLVHGLLAFARAAAIRAPSESADVATVVDRLEEEIGYYAEEHSVTVLFTSVPAVRASCSPAVLMSILRNLVRNAVKYMGASQVRRVTVRTSVASRGRTVRIEVEDSGAGIPAHIQGRLFEPFVSGEDGDEAGVGLGLATASRLVTAHHGRMGYVSRPEVGSLFWFELPTADA